MAGIYLIENNVNGMVYIGRSVSPDMRFALHKSFLRRGTHPNQLLQNDYNEHGENSFSFLVLEESEEDDLCRKESEWIGYFIRNNVAPVYNHEGRRKQMTVFSYPLVEQAIRKNDLELEARMSKQAKRSDYEQSE